VAALNFGKNAENANKCMMPLSYDLEIFLEYLAPNMRQGPNIALVAPIATEILALEKPRKLLFAKMAPKTTSGSGFHLIFRFSVVNLVDNATNLENDPLTFFEKFDVKVEKFKKYFNELHKFPRLSSLTRCGRCGSLSFYQNLFKSHDE